MKKSFTLLELLISITLFMIIVVFLYKTIDEVKYSNNIFLNKQKAYEIENNIYNIFLEDISESSNITISKDKNKNSIVKIKTNNTYHNPYFNYITYLIGANKKLVRIEGLKEFKEQDIITENTFLDTYIDVLAENIEFFEAKNESNTYVLVLKEEKNERKIYPIELLK